MTFENPDDPLDNPYGDGFDVNFEATGNNTPEADLPSSDAIDEPAMTAPDNWVGAEVTPSATPEQIERGKAIARVFDFAGAVHGQMESSMVDHINSDPDKYGAVQSIANAYDESVENVAWKFSRALKDGEMGLGDQVALEQLEQADLFYGGDLAQTGMRMAQLPLIPRLQVEDAQLYTEALEHMPVPKDQDTRDRINTESSTTTSIAIMTASHQVNNFGIAASELPEHGQRIAVALERQGNNPETIEQAQLMGLAHDEDLTGIWATLHADNIIGPKSMRSAAHALTAPDIAGFQEINGALNNLVTLGPRAQFTRSVLDLVESDIRGIIDDPLLDPKLHALGREVNMSNPKRPYLVQTLQHIEELKQRARDR